MSTYRHRTAARLLGCGLGAVALSLAATSTAGAHVSMSTDTAAAGSSAVVTLEVPHGCEGSPTRRIAVRIPDGIPEVVPTVNPGWTPSQPPVGGCRSRPCSPAPRVRPPGSRSRPRARTRTSWTTRRPGSR